MTKKMKEDQSLARLRRDWREKAETVDRALLHSWYERHVAWLQAEVEWMFEAQMKNAALLHDNDPRWARYWQSEARLRYLSDSLLQAHKRGHVMSCLNHGVYGIPESAEVAEAVAYQGEIDGDVWIRYCLDCQADVIKGDGQRLEAAFARLAGLPREDFPGLRIEAAS